MTTRDLRTRASRAWIRWNAEPSRRLATRAAAAALVVATIGALFELRGIAAATVIVGLYGAWVGQRSERA